jgi:hypothetical protein
VCNNRAKEVPNASPAGPEPITRASIGVVRVVWGVGIVIMRLALIFNFGLIVAPNEKSFLRYINVSQVEKFSSFYCSPWRLSGAFSRKAKETCSYIVGEMSSIG